MTSVRRDTYYDVRDEEGYQSDVHDEERQAHQQP